MHWIHSASVPWTWHQPEAGIYDGPQIKQLITDPQHQWMELNHVPELHLFLWEGKKLCTISGGYVLSFQQAWLTSATVHYLVCDICSVSQKLDLTGKNWCHVWNQQQQQQFRISNSLTFEAQKCTLTSVIAEKYQWRILTLSMIFSASALPMKLELSATVVFSLKEKKKSHWQCKHFNSKRLP